MTRFAFNKPISDFMSENRMDEVAAIGAKLEGQEDIFNTKLQRELTGKINQAETAQETQDIMSDAYGTANRFNMIGGLMETGSSLFSGMAGMKAKGLGMFAGSGSGSAAANVAAGTSPGLGVPLDAFYGPGSYSGKP